MDGVIFLGPVGQWADREDPTLLWVAGGGDWFVGGGTRPMEHESQAMEPLGTSLRVIALGNFLAVE